MKRYNLSTRVLGAFAALTLAPVAFAQTAQDPVPNDPASDPTSDPSTMTEEERVPSGDSFGQMPQNERRVPEMSDKQSHKSQEATGQSATQQQRPIDPAEVQQVFGQQASLVDIKSLSADDAKNLQQRLKDLGYYKGEIDGKPGPQTKAALNALVRSQFVLTQRLVEQGQIPSQLATTVGLSSDIMPTSGTTSPSTGAVQPRMSPPSSMQPGSMQPGNTQPGSTQPGSTAQPGMNTVPPASNDSPPANYNDSPRSPSGNNAPTQQQNTPKR